MAYCRLCETVFPTPAELEAYLIAYVADMPPEERAEEGCTFEGALALVRARMDEGLSTKDAVKQVAKLTGFAKNQLYDAILKG